MTAKDDPSVRANRRVRRLLDDLKDVYDGKRGWKANAAKLLNIDAAFVSRVLSDPDWPVSHEIACRLARVTHVPVEFWTGESLGEGADADWWVPLSTMEGGEDRRLFAFRDLLLQLEGAASVLIAHHARDSVSKSDFERLRHTWSVVPGVDWLVKNVGTAEFSGSVAQALDFAHRTLDFVELVRESFQRDRLAEEERRRVFIETVEDWWKTERMT